MAAAPASRALIFHAFALCIAFLAGILASEALWAAPTRLADEPVRAAPVEAKPALLPGDDKIIDRLAPHIGDRIEKKLADDFKGGDKKSFGILAGAIMAFIGSAIKAALETMLLVALIKILFAHWAWLACFVVASALWCMFWGRMGGATARKA